VLLEHPDVAAISFTVPLGPTGQKVAAACIASAPMRKFQLEMGGKNPLVVLDDADLKVAVECRRQQRVLFHRAALHGPSR